ncbi:MAG: hypothetical protein HY720_29290, partial [Planctomycetes bacterium]|nr:hypothetical protein [Planctomycetota bacterium]
MKTTKDRAKPRPHRLGPEDFDERGVYLYPGDVEDAMPEGNLAETMGSYLRETILRLSCDLERDSAYKNLPIYYEQGTKRHVAPD